MSTHESMTPERLAAIQERLNGVEYPTHEELEAFGNKVSWVERSASDGEIYSGAKVADTVGPGVAALIANAPQDLEDLLAEVERLRVLESIVSWRDGDTTSGSTREDMVTRAVEAHHKAFTEWPAKRNLEDAHNRRVAAMRAALDAALGTQEGA